MKLKTGIKGEARNKEENENITRNRVTSDNVRRTNRGDNKTTGGKDEGHTKKDGEETNGCQIGGEN